MKPALVFEGWFTTVSGAKFRIRAERDETGKIRLFVNGNEWIEDRKVEHETKG